MAFTIQIPDNFVDFLAWRQIFDNDLRDQILNYNKNTIRKPNKIPLKHRTIKNIFYTPVYE